MNYKFIQEKSLACSISVLNIIVSEYYCSCTIVFGYINAIIFYLDIILFMYMKYFYSTSKRAA